MKKYVGLVLILMTLLATGCAKGVTYVVDVEYSPALKDKPQAKTEPAQIAVVTFEDYRPDKTIIGTRKRVFGKVDKFDARPTPATEAVTAALVSALKIRGYDTLRVQKGVKVEQITKAPPHIVVSGNVEELQATAVSKFGYTDIKTYVKLKVKVYKVEERTTYTINVQSQAEPRVIFFNPSVMQKAVNDTLTDALNHLIVNQIK